MSALRVIESGILSLNEDFGRYGLCDKGITNSGVMDEYAYGVLNLLLQNTEGSNAVEITMGGLKLEADDNCTVAITGADIGFSINSRKVDNWKSYHIKKGDKLEFGYAKNGLRAYFGVKGGFVMQKELGSYSITLKEEIGRKFQKGDILSFLPAKSDNINLVLKKEYMPTYQDSITLRLILGYQDDFFDEKELEKFFSQTYTITPQINRMAYKLEGEAIASKVDGIISEGISFGAVQIPKDGQPIVLLKERQTIGGYPKIGSVLPIDCFGLSQLKMGGKVNFKPISIEKAQKKMRLFNQIFL